jgi:hypothetical protein
VPGSSGGASGALPDPRVIFTTVSGPSGLNQRREKRGLKVSWILLLAH